MSKNALLEFMQNEYDGLCQKIKPSEHAYRFLTTRQDDGSPHIEIGENEYHFVSTERGLELSRRTTRSKDEILYWLISLDSFWMAVDFEFKNRVENRDSRRLIFARQIELMNKANPLWADRRQKEINAILAENPFTDDL